MNTLKFKYTTSRGRDSYGYNICSLWVDGEKKASTCGGGYDMTDEEVAKSVDLELSDFDDSGDMIEELKDIIEGNI